MAKRLSRYDVSSGREVLPLKWLKCKLLLCKANLRQNVLPIKHAYLFLLFYRIQPLPPAGRLLANASPMNPRLRYLGTRLGLSFRTFGRRKRQWTAVRKRATGLFGGLELAFALADLLGLFDLYEALSNALTPGIRDLTAEELHLLRPIFGDSVPYNLIRIDERAWAGPRWGNFCYVSFHTINGWGPMAPHVLVHEVVHVWQYTRVGAAYVPRALAAQRSVMGYDYGGLEPLRRGTRLEDFNYEQQADIIEDAFRLVNGYRAQWHGSGVEVLACYYPYLREVRRG